MTMKTKVLGNPMFIAGKWVEKEAVIEVLNPQDNSFISAVPSASEEDMLLAIEEAKAGAKIAAAMPVHLRIDILNKAAAYIEEYKGKFAATIALEGSKTIREATAEVKRCVQTLKISAEEARRIHGETIPFDQA